MISKTEQKRAFIIKFLYFSIWLGIIYCLLKYALPLFMPFVIAFLIAFFLKPLINFITKKTPLSRKLTAVLLLTILYLGVGSLLALGGAKLFIYLSSLFSGLPAFYKNTLMPAASHMGTLLDNFFDNLDPSLVRFFNGISDSISQSLSNVVRMISSSAVNMFTGAASRIPLFVVALFLCIIASYFFVMDYYKITSFVTRQLSEKVSKRLFIIKEYVVNVLFRFARAYLILMSITFAEVALGLLILQVKNFFTIALVTAIVDILPIFGSGTVILPWAAYSLFTGNYVLGVGLLVLYAVVTLVRQIMEPRVVGRQIGLYPLLTLICMFIGAQLFGFWGLFGFPITLTVLIYLNRSGEITFFRETPEGALSAEKKEEKETSKPIKKHK